MTWSCVKCGTANLKKERTCQACGARLPFLPPTDSTVHAETPESFRVPKTGELTALLYQGIQQLRNGLISTDEFQERVESALQNVPLVFSTILDEIQDKSEEMTGYGDGVCVSLMDCQALFESGLAELLQFVEAGDDFHLRFGWLLLEKGENEYVEILKTLKRDSANRAFEGADNVLGRLYESLLDQVLTESEYQADLERFETVSRETLKEIDALISQSVNLAKKTDEMSFAEASVKLQEASDKMGNLLLNLHAVEAIETAG